MPPFIRWLRVIFAFLAGAGYALGPAAFSTSPMFVYIKDSFLSVQGWGIIFMLCAVLAACTKMVGFGFTSFVWLLWGMCIAAAALDGYMNSWSAVLWPFFFALVNMYEVARWSRSRVEMVRNERITSFRAGRQLSRAVDRGHRHRNGR